MNEDRKRQIIETLMEKREGFFTEAEDKTEVGKIGEFTRFAMPLFKNSLPNFPMSGSGDHNFKGSTVLEDVDFEALIPPNDVNLEEWYKEKFAEQNIDSSIREEVLKILAEAGCLMVDINNIHCAGLVGVQPMMKDPNCKFNIQYKYKCEDEE